MIYDYFLYRDDIIFEEAVFWNRYL
jgi:hypothetical protein